MLSRFSHRNLPGIYDHFTDPTHWYLVMHYIEGETLDDSLKQTKEGYLSVKEVLAIGVQLSKVLEYLHSCQPPIIFRDVKPANIMRTRWGRLYLIDFGIARQFSPDKTRDTGPLGSPGYAAPEQYGRAQSTKQTDIYGLGATLHTLLTAGRWMMISSTAHAATWPRFAGTPAPAGRDAGDEHRRPTPQHAGSQGTVVFIRQRRTRLVSIGHRTLSFLIGLLIGSLPYIFLPLVWAFSLPDPNASVLWFVVPVGLLFYYWWFVLICQCGAALSFLFFAHPRRRLLAIGILLMLALIYLAILWLAPIGEQPLQLVVRCDSAAALSYLNCHAERRPVMLSTAKHLVAPGDRPFAALRVTRKGHQYPSS